MEFIDIIKILIIIMTIYIYFFPCHVAHQAQNKGQRNGIMVLNLFLGWTFIGWVGALIWASIIEKN